MDLLDTLVDDRGRVAAAEALGVNYRTVARCQQSRRVSRRMRQVLQDTCDDAADIGAGDTVGDDAEETVEYGSAALELENRTLREMVQAQAEEMEVLRRRVSELGKRGQPPGEAGAVDGEQRQPDDWRPGGDPGCLMPVW